MLDLLDYGLGQPSNPVVCLDHPSLAAELYQLVAVLLGLNSQLVHGRVSMASRLVQCDQTTALMAGLPISVAVMSVLSSRQWLPRQLRHWLPDRLMDGGDAQLTGWEYRQRAWLLLACARLLHLAAQQGRWSLLEGIVGVLGEAGRLSGWLGLLNASLTATTTAFKLEMGEAMARLLEVLVEGGHCLEPIVAWMPSLLAGEEAALVEAMAPVLLRLRVPSLRPQITGWLGGRVSLEGRCQLAAACLLGGGPEPMPELLWLLPLRVSQCALLASNLLQVGREWATVILTLFMENSGGPWIEAGLPLALLQLLQHPRVPAALATLAGLPGGLEALEEAGLWERLTLASAMERERERESSDEGMLLSALLCCCVRTERRLAPRQWLLRESEPVLRMLRLSAGSGKAAWVRAGQAASLVALAQERAGNVRPWLDHPLGLTLTMALGGCLVRGLRRLEQQAAEGEEGEEEERRGHLCLIQPTLRLFALASMEQEVEGAGLLARLLVDDQAAAAAATGAEESQRGGEEEVVRMPISVLIRLLTALLTLPTPPLSCIDATLLILLRWSEQRLRQFDDRLVTGNLATAKCKQQLRARLTRPLELASLLPWEERLPQPPAVADLQASIQRWLRELKHLLS